MNDTDTSRFAHIRFPALAWGEKDGTVPTPSDAFRASALSARAR
jgi:anaerobic selenocysteine-containing dehydrogenase